MLLLLIFNACWLRVRERRVRRHHQAARWMASAAWQFAQGNDSAAAGDNSRVLALDPECAPALILRGMISMQMFRFRAAVEDFDRAIALWPRSTLAIYRRGIAKHCLGDLDGAIKDYDLIMTLEPGCADTAPGNRRRRPVHRVSLRSGGRHHQR